ncbi:myosin-16-like [Poecilia latipinna]|uniref:myosin-16-like n=1 Tax=Poecilia latipinna TaxID=48699 RepID=UPI00072E7F7E|nr:PREDICTED: myosin-16-like [Poecilia latipinna]
MLQEEKTQQVQAENLLEILEQELKTERELRAQIEADKEEAVEITEQLNKNLEDMEKTSKDGPVETALDDWEKFELELQKLEKMLQEEKSLRETEKASLLKTVESLQQETDKELQKERALREEVERGKLKLEKVSGKLYQGLEKACKMTETLSGEAELLTNKLQAEEKKRRSLLKDIQELTLMLEKEKALRIEAENYEMEAREILEAFQKEAEYRTWQKKDLKEKRHLIKVQPL